MPVKSRREEPEHEERHFKTPYRVQELLDGQWVDSAWVHCPVCRATSENYSSRGRPRYSAPMVTIKPANSARIVVACSCWLGQRWAAKVGARTLDEFDPRDYELIAPGVSRGVRVVAAGDRIVTAPPAEPPDQLRPGYQAPEPEHVLGREIDQSELFS